MVKKSGKTITSRKASESLLEQVRRICKELAPHGWRELFEAHGLDIESADLESELFRPLARINRTLQGFRDFALEGCRGIEPCKPSYSLLFHAFASPQVTVAANAKPLAKFPTPAQIATVENYVYGARPPSIEELRA